MALGSQFLWLLSGISASLLMQQWNASSGGLHVHIHKIHRSLAHLPLPSLFHHVSLWNLVNAFSKLSFAVWSEICEGRRFNVMCLNVILCDFGSARICLVRFCQWTAKSFAKRDTSSTQKELVLLYLHVSSFYSASFSHWYYYLH